MEDKNIPTNENVEEVGIDEKGVDNAPKKWKASVQKSGNGERTKQKGPFKKTRGGEELTRDEVNEINQGRKKLRKELRAKGIKSKKEFELIASSLGLYFDKTKWFPLLMWFLHGRWLWALLGALAALMAVLFAMSLISQMQGHFTINMSESLFREGFSLSETVGFENPTMRLFAQAAENVPCVSITDIHDDVDSIDGQHNEATYFAYTFYIRNEGEATVSYTWSCHLNSESHDMSDAAWIMIFEDGKMKFYAKPREDGTQEALPYFNDNTRGYLNCPMYDRAADPEAQFQLITSKNGNDFYRMVPYSFLSSTTVASGMVTSVDPMEAHKYTVVIWLEGDDPDCTDDLIGGHAGMDMNFALVDEEVDENEENSSFSAKWDAFWDNLVFWKE